ncbi:MAG: hypothetical protein IJ960_03025 [Oscillospiraceae bacterium]|nr:hypothetical protein [Oscillospiraceae bacterium]
MFNGGFDIAFALPFCYYIDAQIRCDGQRQKYADRSGCFIAKKFGFYRNLLVYPYKLMEKLIDIMEDDDDVQNIWHNWEE